MPIVTTPSVSAQVPSAPTLTAVTAGDGGASATWSAPVSNGGSTLLRYVVTVRVASTGQVVLTQQTAPTVTSTGLSPLANDAAHLVSVVAVNGVGSSQPSASVSVTPTGGGVTVVPPPAAPVIVTGVPEPMVRAFPPQLPFIPENWLRTGPVVVVTDPDPGGGTDVPVDPPPVVTPTTALYDVGLYDVDVYA